MAQYIIDTDPKRKPPKDTITTYKAVLPYVAKLIPKWKAVTAANFNTAQYVAHSTYADTIRNTINSKEELNRLLDEVADDEEEEEE